MQDGDLGTWESKRILLVLEDTCCHITWKNRLIRDREPLDPDHWEWALVTIKTIMRYAYNSVPVEVITFESEVIAGLAAVWFTRYDVDVASVQYYDFKAFTRSLTWRRNTIQEIIDTEPDRLDGYGQYGRQIMFNGEF